MTYNLEKFIDRSGTNSIKWEFMQMFNEKAKPDTIPFWVADMDFACAPPILDSLHKRVDRQIFGYSGHFTGEYFRAVCGWFSHRFDWYVNSKNVFYSPGVVPALSYLINILTKPGDGVIIQSPVYYPFANMINNNNRTLVNNGLIDHDGHYQMDFEDLRKKAEDPNNKLMILCSPHNPVGRVWTEEELTEVGRICIDNNVKIISDEIHFDLVRRGVKHTPIEKLFIKDKNEIITCTAPSKTFNLAGMQLSNIVINDPLIKESWTKHVEESLGVMFASPLSISATQTAYTECEDWLEEVIDYLDENMNFIKEFVSANLPKAKYRVREGTYLVWIDFSGYGLSQEELDKCLFEKGNVLVEGGTIFGAKGEGYIRMNVACSRSLIQKGMEKILEAVNSI